MAEADVGNGDKIPFLPSEQTFNNFYARPAGSSTSPAETVIAAIQKKRKRKTRKTKSKKKKPKKAGNKCKKPRKKGTRKKKPRSSSKKKRKKPVALIGRNLFDL